MDKNEIYGISLLIGNDYRYSRSIGLITLKWSR